MQLCVLTWNCFGAAQHPGDALRERAPAGERLRAPEVRERCSEVDVLCIQELFSGEAQRFFDQLPEGRPGSAFRDGNAPRLWPPSLRGTGLGLRARPPLASPSLRNFRSASGTDRLARKGVLHARIEAGGSWIDLVNVHLQAGYHREAVQVRAAQLAELRAVIDAVGSSGRDFLVCGDLNIDGLAAARDGEEYRRLASTLGDFLDLGARDDRTTFHPHPGENELAHRFEPRGWPQRLDYILHRPAARGPALRLEALERTLDRPLGSTPAPRGFRSAWASDHYGLLATFTAGVPEK
jgi:endonuclease/exonuclease/phosphatase family metal-dependent hydrolase